MYVSYSSKRAATVSIPATTLQSALDASFSAGDDSAVLGNLFGSTKQGLLITGDATTMDPCAVGGDLSVMELTSLSALRFPLLSRCEVTLSFISNSRQNEAGFKGLRTCE